MRGLFPLSHSRRPGSDAGVLGAFALVGLPLSLLAFHLGVRWARITGTLSHF